MIVFDNVSFTYPGAQHPTLDRVSVTIPEGELCLVTGETGSGKSTLLHSVNGLVPQFSGGSLTGDVRVDGRSTHTHRVREMAETIGMVAQAPLSSFVTDDVRDELAYTMESLGVPVDVMRKRVEETLDLLGIADIRDRPLQSLSAGQQQRVAIAATLTAHPKVLVLDEPTSALDPGAAEEVLSAIHRLVHDVGITVLLAEHRLERVVQFADTVMHLRENGAVLYGMPEEVLPQTRLTPPVVQLGLAMGWKPVPISVRQARRYARDVTLGAVHNEASPRGDAVLSVSKLRVSHGSVSAVDGVSFEAAEAGSIAVMGRNGSGKSSMLWAVQGSGARESGSVLIDGVDPAHLKADRRRRLCALLPANYTDLLYLESVADECVQADRESHAPAGTALAFLSELLGEVPEEAHPRDLSEGQRACVALAVTLAARPRVVALDEPTRGLDYPTKAALARILQRLQAAGTAVLLATHDVEFVATWMPERVIVLADGQVVTDSAMRDVVTSSPLYAPQIAKVFSPVPVLSVEEVRAAESGEL